MKRKVDDDRSFEWAGGLLKYLDDPHSYAESIVYRDDTVIGMLVYCSIKPDLPTTLWSPLQAIKDKYPKARFHFLVIPFQRIGSPAELTKAHLPVVRHMVEVGEKLARSNHFDSNYQRE